MRSRGPLPPIVLLSTVLLLLLVHFGMPRLILWRFPATLAGLVPLLAGVYVNLAADRLLKLHRTTVKPFQRSTALVTSGVYGRSRHPMYLGFVLILLGVAALLGSAAPFLVVVLFALLMDVHYIRHEETVLREQFGQEWLAYAERVRRWI